MLFRLTSIFALLLLFTKVEAADVASTSIPYKKKILVLCSNGGYGHNSAAQTLKNLLGDEYDFKVVYPIDQLRILGLKSGEQIYNSMLQNGWIQSVNLVTRHLAPKIFRSKKRQVEAVIKKHIDETAPDLVISLIPFINYPASEAARKAGIPYLIITTDNDLQTWVHGLQGVQHPLFKVTVGSDLWCSREMLRKRNIPDNAIETIGLPIRTDFFAPKDIPSLKYEFNIPPNKPVVLIMIGGAGGAQALEYARRIGSIQLGVHLIVCAGKNKQLALKLRKVPLHPTNTMTIMEFTPKISDLMAISDLLITKPGPGTTTEGMTMRLPILVDTTSPILSWEEVNIQLIMRYGIGDYIRHFDELEPLLRKYLFDTELQKEIRDAYQWVPANRFKDSIAPLIESMIKRNSAMKQIAPCGHWISPITPEWLTSHQKKFGNLIVEGDSLYWEEFRPSDNQRTIVMEKTPQGELRVRTPEGFSCRSRVHEYGGLSFAVSQGKVYYVNEKDQRIYHETDPLTEPGMRSADLHPIGSYLIGVGEEGGENFLFSLHVPTKTLKKIATGHDFYSSPAISPDGTRIAFLSWDHPHMPWDETTLWVGSLQEGEITNLKKAAGGPNESIFQPSWSPSGILHSVSDRTGWWNLYQQHGENWEPLHPMHAEFGLPNWVFGMSTYAFAGETVVCSYNQNGTWAMAELVPWHALDLPWTSYSQIRSTEKATYFIAASGAEDRSIIQYDRSSGQTTVITHNPLPHLDPENISLPQPISFPSRHGRDAYAIYYPPHNKHWDAPPGTLPPLLVISHGGPTACTLPIFDLKIQFWTSRGFAVVDVNYGGSTGYGRSYRDSLKKKWGIVDVEDCEAAAKFLIAQGKVDPSKIAIRGGSAGGYTTLAALTFGKTFTVGASYYGVSDLAALAKETHKFESRYLDELIGPYPADQAIYKERSPLFHVNQLHCPVIFFQGAEDRVVPVNQTQLMYDALKARGIKTELVIYPEEQHGFRKTENIKDSLLRELAFYLDVWDRL